jgi:DNA-directed RNA polymerase specialized sigma24 family protein
MSQSLARHLRALHQKTITFHRFYRETAAEWSRMAAALHKHWKLPPTVTRDDVEQELLLGAWQAVPRWDPSKASLRAFVVWSAHDKALKWIHQQRGCNLHTRKGPSQYAWCIATLARDGQDGGSRVLENHSDGGPESEREIDVDAILRELPDAASSEAGRLALQTYIARGGDEELAARELHQDRRYRRMFGFESAAHVKQIIRQEIRGVRRTLLEDVNEGGG